MIRLLDNKIRGGISSGVGDRYVVSDENKKLIYIDSKDVYVHSMSQLLPYDEIKFDINVKLEHFLDRRDCSDFGYFVESDLWYPEKHKRKNKEISILS